MGLDSEIVGLGAFEAALLPTLTLPVELYASTVQGAPIVESLFRASGTRQSRALATVFEIGPWDFARHQLVVREDTAERLRAFVRDSHRPDAEGLAELVVQRLLTWQGHGFRFFWLPNG